MGDGSGGRAKMNWSDFFTMGGYGFYVWGSYGVTALLIIVEIIWVLQRRKALLNRLARMSRLSKG